MDRAALALDLTGHRDGFAVWFADCVVDIFPSFDGARAGFQAAQWASEELGRVLSQPKPEAS